VVASDIEESPGSAARRSSDLGLRAEQLYLEGDEQGAEELFLQLAFLPETPRAERAGALVTAAWLQYLRLQEDAAAASLEQALETDANVDLDVDLFDDGFLEILARAREQIRLRKQAEAKSLLERGRQLLDQGNFKAARQDLEAALALFSEPTFRAHAMFSLGIIDLKAGDHDTARVRFEEVLALPLPPEARRLRAGAHSNLAALFFRRELYADAERAWLAATEIDPEASAAWRNLGLARAEQGKDPEAIVALRTAYGLDPQDSEAVRLLGRSLVRVGAVQEAIGILETGVHRNAKDAGLLLALGSALRAAVVNEEAIEAYKEVVRLDQSNRTGEAERAAAHLSSLFSEENRFDEAERWARMALGWDANSPEHWNRLAIVLRARGRLEESLAAFERSAELEPTRSEFSANLGSVLAQLRRFPEAELAFERAVRLDPENLFATEGLSLVRSNRASIASSRETEEPSRSPQVRKSHAKALSPKKLGLRFAELDYDRLGLRGALVREVVKRSPAARTGLRRGDLILRLDGYQILDDKDFFSHLKRNPPVEGLEIEILRDASIDHLALKIQ
jgi:tetratricopeptide (TPR) repeat protein